MATLGTNTMKPSLYGHSDYDKKPQIYHIYNTPPFLQTFSFELNGDRTFQNVNCKTVQH